MKPKPVSRAIRHLYAGGWTPEHYGRLIQAAPGYVLDRPFDPRLIKPTWMHSCVRAALKAAYAR